MKHSASRALALLRAMNLRPVSSVRDLALDTGISKPSVVRLLAILIEDGYVQRAPRPGSYTLTDQVQSLSSGFREDTTLARAAGPILEALTAQIQWPTALGFFEQGAMVVRYSTIPSSPLAWYRTTLYLRLSLLGSAMGQVFLAWSDPRTRRALIDASDDSGSAPEERTEQYFEQVRKRGVGLRTPTREHPTISISVPITLRGKAAAALSVTIYARAMTVDQAITRYRDLLNEAALKVAAATGIGFA